MQRRKLYLDYFAALAPVHLKIPIVPLALLTLLAACSSPPPPPAPCAQGLIGGSACQALASFQRAEASQNLQARLFVDGTDSMRGFVNATGATTRYQQLLRALEDGLQQFPQVQRQSFKFGTSVAAVPSERRLNVLAGKNQDFYKGVGLYTELEQVLNDRYLPSRSGQLGVIVTDLFQRDTDVTSLIRLLKNRYLQKGWVVGIVGVESAFDGVVFDLDTEQAKKSIRANRPVYALVLGSYVDVAHYFDGINQADSNLQKQAQFLIFTARPFRSRVNFFSEAPAVEAGDGGLIDMGLLEDERTYWFRLQGEPPTATFKACGQVEPLPYALAAEVGGDWRAQVLAVPTGTKPRPLPAEVVQVRTDAGSCETAAKDNPPSRPLGVAVQVETKALNSEQSADYFFALAAHPELNTFPRWWDSWNTDDAVNEPSRTLHLKQFLRSLAAVALNENAGSDLSMYFYIRR
ncbi:hypothetical protein GKIL_0218 [Gloeobacter kilaueensis JS1]|uniref:Uncharacterized protein n=1 Tax=Gloeobacter kilaueensis (strain ATCC BAA-2537 / CCAP 1431/1 / ULC 316 / JS1) TaxID=1183438 RepID=U5QFL4_GLOK1|nr:hypothetical protein GKIL_0218 [Gloeobacter kilaueensis JS1]